jgi:transcriptional regulator with XRE-family HTH domain
MSGRNRPHLPVVSDGKDAPKQLTKEQFGQRVYNLMVKKGWTQSELARQADMPRDSISLYVRGRTFPQPHNLQKLADALDVDPEQLLPNYAEMAIQMDSPVIDIKVSSQNPKIAWLRVNRLVTTRTALSIAELLNNDEDVADATRSGDAT